MNKLAYYTCYFGGYHNYSRLIPPIPSEKYDCYFFTNDNDIYNFNNDPFIQNIINYLE